MFMCVASLSAHGAAASKAFLVLAPCPTYVYDN